MLISILTMLLYRVFGAQAARGLQKAHRPRASLFPRVDSLEHRELLAMAGVDIFKLSFAPNPVTIHVGDTVHWVWDTNNESTTSVAGSSESWNSGVHNAGHTFDHTFTHVGTFAYYCSAEGHDNGNGTARGMSGTVVVLPAAPLSMIMVTPAAYSIAAGASQQYMAMGMYADNVIEDLTNDVTWSSTNTSVVTVFTASASPGLVTGIAQGTANISATLGSVMGATQVAVTVAAAPFVTISDVHAVVNRRHRVTEIIVTFGGALEATETNRVASFGLSPIRPVESFFMKLQRAIKLRSATYTSANNTVVIVPTKPFPLARLVQLVDGMAPMGLQDSFGRLIDGDNDGTPRGNVVTVLRRSGATIKQ
jgi:plastocyanin